MKENSMKTIRISASTEYDVIIGSGLLCKAPELIRSVTNAQALCIVSDHTVWSFYGDDLKDTLADAGYRCVGFTFPAGEHSKTMNTYGTLLEFLTENRIGRADCIVALGGGVAGDLAGFAAATYLRGIDYVQIPTTLLAMVDSSVGGKTAIDLPNGKNLVGAFYQPKVVLCDTDTLSSLPETVFCDGCAEVVKYGVLFDRELFAELEHFGTKFDREKVIGRCVELKRDIVAADEYDRGQRMLLNFGHTIGHGIEAVSNYQVSHGCAVSIGMAIISKACAANGFCGRETAERIRTVLDTFHLPCETDNSAECIANAALSDKKRSGDTIRLIVCREIGHCDILPVPTESLSRWIQAGLKA
jgi:3-dehydroquinate synthase